MTSSWNRERGWLHFLLAASLAFAGFIIIGPASAGHAPTDICLDVDQETSTNPTGTTHSVTATIKARGAPAAGDACDGGAPHTTHTQPISIDFEVSGPNDPLNDGDSPQTPDLICDIPAGESQCTSTAYTGRVPGTDTIRGWIDHDHVQSTADADLAEQRDDSSPAMWGTGDECDPANAGGEPDCTDVVSKTWETGPAATLDCDDARGPDTEREANPHGRGTADDSASSETYTCTVRDSSGNPTTKPPSGSGTAQVFGENETGINDPDADDSDSESSPDYSCSVRSDGICTVIVRQSEGEKGTAEICFWVDSAAGRAECAGPPTQEATGETENNDLADQVEKTWEDPRLSGVDAEPETDTNRLGEQHTITATVYNQFGENFEQGPTTVYFEFFSGSPSDTDGGNSPGTPDRSCQTPSNGSSCSITYSQATNTGTDLVCVYIDRDPAAGVQGPSMSGSSPSGTCDGESLNDPDDDATGPDAPDAADDDQDVVQKTWQPAAAATRLNCDPETDTNPTNTTHTFTCTATNEAGGTPADTDIDVEMTGASDPDGNTPTNPDFTCRTTSTGTNSNGTCTFMHFGSSSPGTTTYRAWIDSDKNNNSTEADAAEGRNEVTTPGRTGGAEPDETDVIEKTWQCPTGSPSPSPSPTGPSPTPTSCPTPTPTATATATATPTSTPTQSPPPRPECSDGVDNDGDGAIDFPADPGCGSANDDSEEDIPPECTGEGIIAGTDGPDILSGTAGDDVICGFGGNDSITGLGGDDVLLGGGGDDDINGGDGADSIEADQVAACLQTGCADGNDTVDGGGSKDTIRGHGGNDALSGGDKNDLMVGGQGNDVLRGQSGWDTIRGNADEDRLVGNAGNDILQGGAGNDLAKGGGGNDTIRGFTGRDNLRGGGGNDILKGAGGRDQLRGGRGDDVVDGGAGRDACFGGAGRDTLRRCE